MSRARSRSSRASCGRRPAPCLYSQGETRVICTASVSDEGPALDGGPRPRLGHGRVLDASGVHRRAQGARLPQGPPGRARGRDPAPDRALASRGRRPRRARRAERLRGLRRAPGRRRHPLRVDHRRLGRAQARARLPDARRARSPGPDHRPARRHLAAGSSTARRCATSTTPRTPGPRWTPTS